MPHHSKTRESRALPARLLQLYGDSVQYNPLCCSAPYYRPFPLPCNSADYNPLTCNPLHPISSNPPSCYPVCHNPLYNNLHD